MDRWLLRNSDNHITGPYTAENIKEKILNGQLSLRDEICPANSYWFALHDHDEVKKHFGTEVQKKLHASDEEITETQTETIPELIEEPDTTAVVKSGSTVPHVPIQTNTASITSIPVQTPKKKRPNLRLAVFFGISLIVIISIWVATRPS